MGTSAVTSSSFSSISLMIKEPLRSSFRTDISFFGVRKIDVMADDMLVEVGGAGDAGIGEENDAC